MTRLASHAFAFAALFAAVPALAQEPPFPVKPVRLLVGQAPGGATDLVARAISQKMTESMGQSAIVDNRTGAAGSIAAAQVAKSPPDGYTALVISSSYSINPSLYQALPFDPVKDLQPVTLLAEAPFLLVVHPSMPVNSVASLLSLAKSKPGSLNFASGGTGSSGHLAGELFLGMTGVKMSHIPYKGAGPALVDVIAGQVHLTFGSVISSLNHVRSGKLKALGVTSLKRSKAVPDIPTVSEAGVKGYTTTSWYGVLLPAGVRPAVLNRMNAEAKKAVMSNDVRDRLMGDGAEPIGNSPDEFQKYLVHEIEKWQKVVKAAGIKPE